MGFPEQWILDFCFKKRKKKPSLRLLTSTTPWYIEGASLPSRKPGRDRQLYPESLREGLLGVSGGEGGRGGGEGRRGETSFFFKKGKEEEWEREMEGEEEEGGRERRRNGGGGGESRRKKRGGREGRERDLNFPSGRGAVARQGLADGRDWRAPPAAARGSSRGPSSPGGVARGGSGSWNRRRNCLAEFGRSPAVAQTVARTARSVLAAGREGGAGLWATGSGLSPRGRSAAREAAEYRFRGDNSSTRLPGRWKRRLRGRSRDPRPGRARGGAERTAPREEGTPAGGRERL